MKNLVIVLLFWSLGIGVVNADGNIPKKNPLEDDADRIIELMNKHPELKESLDYMLSSGEHGEKVAKTFLFHFTQLAHEMSNNEEDIKKSKSISNDLQRYVMLKDELKTAMQEAEDSIDSYKQVQNSLWLRFAVAPTVLAALCGLLICWVCYLWLLQILPSWRVCKKLRDFNAKEFGLENTSLENKEYLALAFGAIKNARHYFSLAVEGSKGKNHVRDSIGVAFTTLHRSMSLFGLPAIDPESSHLSKVNKQLDKREMKIREDSKKLRENRRNLAALVQARVNTLLARDDKFKRDLSESWAEIYQQRKLLKSRTSELTENETALNSLKEQVEKQYAEACLREEHAVSSLELARTSLEEARAVRDEAENMLNSAISVSYE